MFLGDLRPLQHQTSGKLYAIDEKTFFIQNFNYDGLGPSEYNWLTLIHVDYPQYIIAVFVYVYLTGQTVDRRGGGTVINWSPT